jgi:hypothetical protein
MSISQEDIKRIVEGSRLRADHEFEHPPICLAIEGNYGNETFATLGNFSTLLALPKVGKTTATGIIVSSLLKGKQISNFIPSLPDEKKNILWIDTEQGEPECVKIIRTIAKQVNGDPRTDPENLIYYPLRRYNRADRIQITEYLIKNTPDLGFVVIDGIRDFVSSINDEREATAIADYLLKWTQEYNIHIFTILHQNKGDDNARGHLGSELMNKAETVATLSREDFNGKRSTVFKPKFTRHKDFQEFSFTVDEDGNISNTEIKSTYEPKSPQPNQLTFEEITTILKQTFGNNESYTYAPLQNKLHTVCEKIYDQFGMTKCGKLITYLKDKNYIIQKEGSKEYIFNRYPL